MKKPKARKPKCGILFSLENKIILLYETTWMNWKYIMLSKISHSHWDKYCFIIIV